MPLLIVTFSYGQKIEFSGGINQNSFFDLQAQDNHLQTKYDAGYGYSAGIFIYDIKFDTIHIGLSLRYDYYQGSFYSENSGLSYGHSTKAEVKKSTVGIGLYPLNFSVLNKIRFHFGIEFSVKLDDQYSGYKSSWSIGPPLTTTTDSTLKYLDRSNFWGICGRISYDFKINENWFIAPQYRFYFGLSEEFNDVEAKIKSMRQSLEIGIIRKI